MEYLLPKITRQEIEIKSNLSSARHFQCLKTGQSDVCAGAKLSFRRKVLLDHSHFINFGKRYSCYTIRYFGLKYPQINSMVTAFYIQGPVPRKMLIDINKLTQD